MADETVTARVRPQWVADRIGLPSVDLVYREARLGRLPHRRLGRRVLFYRDEIEAFCVGQPRREPAGAAHHPPGEPEGEP